ncbi:hypothetical protein D3C75_1129720 [compost metagenome]
MATWREGCLLLIVTDGQWATHLRYQQKRLLRQLQNLKEFENLTKILFKIQPTAAERHATGRNLQLSASAADTLRTAASSIDDPQLRAALERLASHTRPPD